MKQISEMGVNRKFYFRWNLKFYWELSNVILGENWLFKRDRFSKWDFVSLYKLCDFQNGILV